jgi:hypothetical protein
LRKVCRVFGFDRVDAVDAEGLVNWQVSEIEGRDLVAGGL